MIHIEGIQQAQDGNLRTIAALQPSGGLGRAVHWMTTAAHRGVVTRVHVDTGTYRAGTIMSFDARQMVGRVFVDPAAVNPKTGERAADYAPVEEMRGGEHAAFYRTYVEDGDNIVNAAGQMFANELP